MSLKLSVEPYLDFVEYNKTNKRFQGLVLIGLVFIVAVYFGFLRDLGLFKDTFVADIFGHFISEIKDFSFLGFFYIYFFGGLILLFIPAEPYYFAAVGMGKFHLHYFFAIFAGIILSYSVNYLIGLRFSKLSALIVSPKNFYKTKTYINKWSFLAIFFSNLFSFGSQQVSFVLGVFKYNKLRLLVLTVAGQGLKYLFLTLVMSGIIRLF